MFVIGFLLFCPLKGDGEDQNYFTFGSTVSKGVAVQGESDSVVDEPNKLYDKGDVVLRFTLYFSSSSAHLCLRRFAGQGIMPTFE